MPFIKEGALKMMIPENVSYIINRLNQNGFEAYAVGGCVRDSLIGRVPGDWDITTSAKPEEVKALFRRTIDTGIQHGTVTVMLGKEGYEVTTYRIDGIYVDSRHPESVTFTPDLTEDLKRRDFTINAMAVDSSGKIVDLFGGQDDLIDKIIRCVGSPLDRFQEDALRMMRAIRFSAQLGFSIGQETLAAIRTLAPSIEKISAERIQMELVKLLVSPHPEKFRLLYETGLTSHFLPEFDRMMETPQNTPYHCFSVGNHTLAVICQVPPTPSLRIAALLHDVGKPPCRKTDAEGRDHFYGHASKGAELAKDILKRLKFDNDTLHCVQKLVRHHSDSIPCDSRGVRRALNRIGEDIFPLLLQLMEADNKGKNPEGTNERLQRLKQIDEIYRQILSRNECVSLKSLSISGNDLIDLGIPKGKLIGQVLQYCLECVLENPEKNDREVLCEIALNYMNDMKNSYD